MQRRSTAVSGCVNFPVNDCAWTNTKSGGMVVKLVVCDNQEFDSQFGVCSGAQVVDILAESFVGDDQLPKPLTPDGYTSAAEVIAEQKAVAAWERYHFPCLYSDTADATERYLSRDYLAALVLGSTGWSGWNEVEQRTWECRFDDLTPEGKALYRQLEALYPGCTLHLLTFLDT